METRTSVKDEPLPLRIVKGFAEIYPDCYSVCDDFVRESKDEMSWWDMVDLPIGATIGIMQETYGLHSLGEIANKGAALQAFYSWRRYKEIFSVDPDLCSVLLEKSGYGSDSDIPVDSFLQLPYHSLYVDCEFKVAGLHVCGFFVSYDDDFGVDIGDPARHELRILYICSDGYMGALYIPLVYSKKLGDVLMEVRGGEKMERAYIEEVAGICEPFIKILLYLCCDNADITEDALQKPYTRKATVMSAIKDIPREMRIWDVGWRIGRPLRISVDGIRKDRKESEELQTVERYGSGTGKGGAGVSKRPHVRAGHFHHFWKGTGADRHLVLHWLPPVPVNCSYDNEAAATVRKLTV